MATSSTDAFSGALSVGPGPGPQLFNNSNYSMVSVSTGPNFWPTEAASTSTSSPASEHNWDVDEEEAVKRRLYELKRQFHNGRFLVIRHLPRDASEEEVRELLSGYLVHSVQLQPSSGTARVLLAEPEVLETWAKSSQHNFRGHKVTISPSNTEGLLCVSRLPLDMSEEEFGGLVGALGEVSYCFLMRSEKSGESKGYGFVEYVTKEVALQAKSVLDGREMRDTLLVCDWLDPCHVTFASLHSTCLYVDQLPKDYRDMGEFRRIFSKVTNPPYCQIAMRNGAVQDWGLVEFINAEDAEETQSTLHNYLLRGQRIRVQYCIPGVRAINIYMKILSDPGLKKKSALLPEPPANKVFSQLQNLTKHNPAFATSLQNIILTQIQSLGVNTDGGPPAVTGPPAPPRGNRAPPAGNGPPQRAPSQPPPTSRSTSPTSNSVLNTNAQAALVILLAAQMQLQSQQSQQQQQQQGANLLSSPHVLSLLQSLVQQGDPQSPHRGADNSNGYSKVQNATNGREIKSGYRNGYGKNGHNKPAKTPLLPTPGSGPYGGNNWDDGHAHSGGGGGGGGGGGAEPESGGLGPLLSGLLSGLPGLGGSQGAQKVAPTKDDLQGTISTLLSNAHNLQQLLGTLTSGEGAAATQGALQGLQGPPPAPAPPPTQLEVAQTTLLPAHIPTSAPPPLYPSNPLMSMLLTAAAGAGGQAPKPALLGDGPLRHDHPSAPAYLPAHLAAPPPMEQPPPPPPVSSCAPAFLFASPVTSRVTTSWSPPPMAPPPPPALLQSPILHPAALPPHPRLLNPLYLTPTKSMAPPPHTFNPAVAAAPGYVTPVGHKRKSNHILPSPEPSPENGYVGQHSQGLGGHYQDSYLNKKLKKH